MKINLVKCIHYIICMTMVVSYSNSIAQPIDSIWNKNTNQVVFERIHLHFDKATYIQGESIWFKAYIMSSFETSTNSKNLYVDWADSDGNILAHQMYPIGNGGTTRGQFQIPEIFSSNMLQVHAYTKWMLNDDPALLYHHTIPIIHNKKQTVETVINAAIPSLQFLPEGGESVIGLVNKIAFIANDQWGRPLNIIGEIQNSKGETIVAIKPQHDGMGFIKMIPNLDETYIAKWTDEQGNAHQTLLPPSKTSGVVLNVLDRNGEKYFSIQRTEAVAEDLKQIHIVGTMQEKPVYRATVNLKNTTSVSSVITTEGFNTGGLVITLFNANWQPISERVCFVDHLPASVFAIKITFDQPNFNKRGLNEFQIDIPDSIPTNLSISITDATLARDNSDNILSRLLLTGDIRGKVYHPSYYFSDTSSQVKQQLDLVMLTHGWRKFNWKKMIQQQTPAFIFPKDTSYFTLSGKVSGVSAVKLINAGDLFLIITNKNDKAQTHFIPMNQDGSFSKPNLLLFDSTKVFYKFSKKPGLEEFVKFELNNLGIISKPKFAAISINAFAPYKKITVIDAKGNQDLMERAAMAKAKELPPVVVTAKQKTQKEKLDDQYVINEMFKGSGAMRNASLDIAQDKNSIAYANVFGYMQARVAGLRISGDLASHTSASAGDGGLTLSGDANLALYIDETPADIPSVGSLSMNEVAYIKVFYAPFVGAPLNGSAIVIYTKKGNNDGEPSEKMPFVKISGYTPLREFYLPNYESKDSSNIFEDLRPTIYWNPMIVTNTQNHALNIRFYNNDVSKSFRIILEGINQLGQLTHIEKVIQ